MIQIATVHFGTAQWVDVQLGYLRRTLSEPYLVWANLQNVAPGHESQFDRVVPAKGDHPGKLNLLAGEILAEARPTDVVIFLDGDAFPITDPMPTIRKGLDSTSLVAVRRDENDDCQPHPCFCAVEAGEWSKLHGDWSRAYGWVRGDSRVKADVGGNLLRALERSGREWTPLLRSNRVNVHPLWFAVYGDIVYHHGAGFRKPISRIDLNDRPPSPSRGRGHPVLGRLLRMLDDISYRRWETRVATNAERMGEAMFDRLKSDPDFYRDLI